MLHESCTPKNVAGHQLKFNHVTKLYWLEDKVTKGDMLNYYYKVGEYMMPYLKDLDVAEPLSRRHSWTKFLS